MSRKPNQNIDYTSRDYEAFRESLINELKVKMPEYTDTSSTDAGIVILEALANGLDIISLYLDVTANDVLLPTTQDRRLATLISKCLGYTPYNKTASEYMQVFELEGVREEDVQIAKGTVVKTKESSDLATLYFETLEDLVIPAGCLGNEQDENENYLYSVRIQHGTSVYGDILGTSTNAPTQTFKLNYTGVIVDSIELYVTENGGQKELWRRVNSFLGYDENAKVYTVSVDEFDVCTVEFGNGIRGKIPSEYPNGIEANYKIGGGEIGNVDEHTITELDDNIPFVKATFNTKADVLGHEKESLNSIKENAPATFRIRDRLVTLKDYSDSLKMNFFDFLHIKAVRDEEDKRLANIYYMLRPDYEMTDVLNKKVTEYIAERSMIGTSFALDEYTPQSVDLDCTLYVDKDFDADELLANIRTYIEGVTFSYGSLAFEDVIVKSDLENEIKATFDGVLSFRINSPTEDIITPDNPQNVLTKGNINITAKYI